MYAARLVVVLILILTVLMAYNPQVRERAAVAWQDIKPALVAFIDHFYVAFRSFISINDSEDQIDEIPVPGSGGNFDRIVTQNNSYSF